MKLKKVNLVKLTKTNLSWMLATLAMVTLLVFGTVSSRPASTNQERVQEIAATVKCPICSGQSAQGSDAPSAQLIRVEIAKQVQLGRSDEQVRAFVAARFGDSIVLTPPASGVAGLVWVIPVVGVALATVLLGLAFAKWRRDADVAMASDDDRVVVERARADLGGGEREATRP